MNVIKSNSALSDTIAAPQMLRIISLPAAIADDINDDSFASMRLPDAAVIIGAFGADVCVVVVVLADGSSSNSNSSLDCFVDVGGDTVTTGTTVVLGGVGVAVDVDVDGVALVL
jgi:hypothetical protein